MCKFHVRLNRLEFLTNIFLLHSGRAQLFSNYELKAVEILSTFCINGGVRVHLEPALRHAKGWRNLVWRVFSFLFVLFGDIVVIVKLCLPLTLRNTHVFKRDHLMQTVNPVESELEVIANSHRWARRWLWGGWSGTTKVRMLISQPIKKISFN